jgi:hypothetical protein
MMGDDGAGPLLAELCAGHPPAGWQVIDGGAAPENDIGHIRELRPDRLVIVDATDMGLAPGETRVIDEKDIAAMFIMTTHNLPLNVSDRPTARRHSGNYLYRHSARRRGVLLPDQRGGETGGDGAPSTLDFTGIDNGGYPHAGL